jgi:hypothetical protein
LLIAPHTANREVLYTSYNLNGNLDQIEYAMMDALLDRALPLGRGNFSGGALYDVPAIRRLLRNQDLSLVRGQDGLLLFDRHAEPHRRMVTQIHTRTLATTEDMTPLVSFGDEILLLDFAVEKRSDTRYRLRFDWTAADSLSDRAVLFAVSRFEGVPLSRFPHLPTVVLYQTSRWEPDVVVTEVFDIELPDDAEPGSYDLVTGWYDSKVITAYETDERSRIGDEAFLTTLSVNATSH